jgi:hypothetical protein
MPTPDVQVRFGANITDLVEGVDGVKSSIEDLRNSLRRVAEAFGVALSIEGLKTFVESMAELGEKTTSTAAVLGASNQQVIELSGFAKLTGTTIEDLSTGIERMTLNIQRSTRDGFNPTAQALKILHLNAQDLIGLPVDQYYAKLAEAAERFNPSLNLTNALMEIGGRGVAQILPSLLAGAERFREFQAAVRQASEGLAEAIPGMADTHEKLSLLGISAQSLGARIFSTLKPAIDQTVEGFTAWLQSIKAEDIRSAVATIGNAMISIAESVMAFFARLGLQIETFKAQLESLKPQLSVTLTGPAAATVRFFSDPDDHIIRRIREEWDKPIVLFGEAGKAGAAEGLLTIEQRLEAIHKGAEEARKSLAAMLPPDVSQMRGAGMGGGAPPAAAKENAPGINFSAGDAIKAQLEALRARMEEENIAYQADVEHITTLAQTFQITEQQKTQYLVQAINQREQFQSAELEQALRIQGLTKEQYQKLQDELTKIKLKGETERNKVEDQAFVEGVKNWTSVLSTVQGAWDSQLRGLLAGTTTWAQAMKNIFADLVIAIIQFFERLAIEKLALMLTNAFGNPANIAQSIAGINANVGQAFAGFAAFLAPTQGPAAIPEATALAASVEAGAMALAGVSQLDVGGYVLKPGLAMIHAGETIVPAKVSTPYQGAPGAGGGDVHFHIGTFIGHQAYVNQLIPQIQRALSRYGRLNPSMAA